VKAEKAGNAESLRLKESLSDGSYNPEKYHSVYLEI